MPVFKALFNRFLWAFASIALSMSLFSSAAAQNPTLITTRIPALSEENKRWLGQQIFANECNSDFNCLTSWNEGEDFPSLGIGHFIWFQQGQEGDFTETFPQLIRYMAERGADLPTWLERSEDLDSPWATRRDFFADIDSERMVSLRELLAESIDLQVDFIIQPQSESGD